MTIKVPAYVLKHNLTDHELVFSSFMGYLGRRGAKHFRFYMYSDDIKHLLGHVKKHKSLDEMVAEEYREHGAMSDEYLENIKKVFHIGMPSYHKWSVSFNCPDDQWNTNGSLPFADVEITNIEAIKVYYYMIGRVSGNNIISDEPIKFDDGTARHTTVLAKFFREHFMI